MVTPSEQSLGDLHNIRSAGLHQICHTAEGNDVTSSAKSPREIFGRVPSRKNRCDQFDCKTRAGEGQMERCGWSYSLGRGAESTRSNDFKDDAHFSDNRTGGTLRIGLGPFTRRWKSRST